MKKVSILLALLIFPQLIAGQSFWESVTTGSWEGNGTLIGSQAEFDMNWQWILDDRFLKLEFQNKRTSDTGEELILKSHAYYQQQNDSLFTGTWFNSRGITFPVSGVLKDSTFKVNWRSPETERGKTIYTLVSKEEMLVIDYVLQGENYIKFGEA